MSHPIRGRSRQDVSLREGYPTRPRAGRTAAARRARGDQLLRAVLLLGGVRAASAWTWPAVCPAADPVAVLVRVHTPNFYRAGVAWDDLTPGWAVFLAGQFLISTSRSWVARMGIRVGRRSRLPAWPLSPTPGRTRGR